MKFSYSLIKKLVPGIKSKAQLIEALNLHSFETADLGGDVIDVSVWSNRFSDAASHLGIAREGAAILNKKLRYPDLPPLTGGKSLKIEVKDRRRCPRYAALLLENIKVKPSPDWLQKILKDCGLRPINNVVDIMNYVMLETGQPLHAFDADKIKGNLIIRRARKGESVVTIDGANFKLLPSVLVIADKSAALAIAGVKGGKSTEVDKQTKNIIVEAANFDPVNIYKTSKFLNLTTDASLRFSHGLSPTLVELGLQRAAALLKGTGAKVVSLYDSKPKPAGKKLIEFDVQKFNQLIGATLISSKAIEYLRRLGFLIKTDRRHLVEVPPLRQDIDNFEDLAEEVARLSGYNRLKAAPPKIALQAASAEEPIVFKDQLRKILTGFGLSEVYNYSFVSKKDLESGDFWSFKPPELANPISTEFQFLRPNLAVRLLKNVEANFRFFPVIRIFEIGKVFHKDSENLRLGIALASKNKETIF